MPRLSLGPGVSSSSKLPSAAAPSNIPLSQTNISLTGFSYIPIANPEVPFSLIARSAISTRENNASWYSDLSSPNNPTGFDILLTFSAGAWRIDVRFFDPDFTELAATNPAPNTSIPVTGWVLEAGAGNSGSVTITAA